MVSKTLGGINATAMLDIQALRAETPAVSERIHFNNAGCSLTPRPVQEALLAHLALEQTIGGYEAVQERVVQLENFYTAFASLLHCQADEIAFVENATRAWDLALSAIPLKPGDQIMTSDMEYASNYLQLLHLSRRKGVEIITVPTDGQGLVDLDAMRAALTSRSRLVALTHIGSQRGDIQLAAEVGDFARDHDLWYLLDACQSAGQLPLNVDEIGCHMLCGTGRKYLRGPRGTGFLYVKLQRLPELEPEFIDLHAAEWVEEGSFRLRSNARRFENWERFVAGQAALAAAVDYANRLDLTLIQQRIEMLAKTLHQALRDTGRIALNERSTRLSGIVTFSKSGEDAKTLHARLLQAGINTSVVKMQNARLDLGRHGQGDINRASLHYFNTEEEIEQFVDALMG